MCKTIKNTRWLCHSTRNCHPRDPYLPSIELRPDPFVAVCRRVDAFTGVCYGTREVVNNSLSGGPFIKTLECPKHHRKRLANLKEAWYPPSFFFRFQRCPLPHRNPVLSSKSRRKTKTLTLRPLTRREEAWTTQILTAQPGETYRRVAAARRDAMDLQRDAQLRRLEADAEQTNTEFYAEALAWQLQAVQKAMNESVENLI